MDTFNPKENKSLGGKRKACGLNSTVERYDESTSGYRLRRPTCRPLSIRFISIAEFLGPFSATTHSSLRFFVQQITSEMSNAQGSHSLAFRVMRLCRPSFQVDPPLRLDPVDLLVGEDILDDPVAANQLPRLLAPQLSDDSDSDLSYSSRFLLHDSSDAMGLNGLLVLPQAFGFFSSSLFLYSLLPIG